MILLMDVWTSGNDYHDVPEWAVVSLTDERIQLYLDRIYLAQKISGVEHAAFHSIEYWDNMPVWVGCSEVWEELYPEDVQIVSHLQAGNEQGESFGTECTMLVVTPGGVSWKTTMKSAPGTAGTEEVSKAMLLELKLRQAIVSRRTGQCQRYPEAP